MPRPVEPIALPPAARSRAWSRAMWYGMISGAAGEIFRRERTSTPEASSSAISFCSAAGEITTPLPIRHSASSRRMPDGISVQDGLLAVDDQGVAGVVAALEAHDGGRFPQ